MTFPETPLPTVVELFYDDVWNDITRVSSAAYVGGLPDLIDITRGRSNEAGQVEASRCSLRLNNRDGRFSPRNPLSPLYGKIGRNTPLRVSVPTTGLPVFEDFEDATLNITVTDGGDAAWARSTDDASTGTWSFKAGAITHDQTSDAIVTVPTGAQTLSFAWRVSSEEGFDFFQFFVEGVPTELESGLFNASGDLPWAVATVDVTGATTVTFRYLKDDSVSELDDTAFVDNIHFTSNVRFTGEVPAWPQRWDRSGQDIWVPIEAAGILRRLGQGQPSLESAIWRQTQRLNESSRVRAYFPFEDGAGSHQIASGLADGTRGTVNRTVNSQIEFASVDGVPGSDQVARFTEGSSWLATIGGPWFQTTSGWRVEWLWRMDETPPSSVTVLRVRVGGTGSPPITRWDIRASPTVVTVTGFDDDAVVLATADSAAFDTSQMFNSWTRWSFRVSVSGGDVQFACDVYNLEGDLATLFVDFGLDTGETGSAGRVVQVGIGTMTLARSWAHLVVTDSSILDPFIDNVIFGHAGETAAARMTRLAAEEDVPLVIIGDPEDTTVVGAQLVSTFIDLIREAGVADQGILYEPRSFLGLAYRTRVDLYNQAPALELDYTDGVFSSIPEPVDDDQLTRNDITVTRQGGSSTRRRQVLGTLSVQPPPDGVGVYATSLTVNLQGDAQLPNDASWRLSLGTADEARFPRLPLHLHHPVFAEDAALTTAAAGLDLGDRICIDNMPTWVSHDLVEQMAQGFTERLSNFLWFIDVNATPYSPYQVAVYGEEGVSAAPAAPSRYSSAGTVTTASFVSGTDTALAVGTLVRPYWTTDTANMPFDILVAGVRLRVTAISAPSGDFQTMTVQQTPINGIVKTIPAVSVVALWQPAVYAL